MQNSVETRITIIGYPSGSRTEVIVRTFCDDDNDEYDLHFPVFDKIAKTAIEVLNAQLVDVHISDTYHPQEEND